MASHRIDTPPNSPRRTNLARVVGLLPAGVTALAERVNAAAFDRHTARVDTPLQLAIRRMALRREAGDPQRNGGINMGKHDGRRPANEPQPIGGYPVSGRIGDRIRAQSPAEAASRDGGGRDSSNNDRHVNP